MIVKEFYEGTRREENSEQWREGVVQDSSQYGSWTSKLKIDNLVEQKIRFFLSNV